MTTRTELTEAEETARGHKLIEVLGLRVIRSGTDAGRVSLHTVDGMVWGTKTPLGLYRTVKRLIEEG